MLCHLCIFFEYHICNMLLFVGYSRTCWSGKQSGRPGISRTQGKTQTPSVLPVLENTSVLFNFEGKLRNETKYFLPIMVVWSSNMCNVLMILMTAIDVLCIYCKLHDCITLQTSRFY